MKLGVIFCPSFLQHVICDLSMMFITLFRRNNKKMASSSFKVSFRLFALFSISFLSFLACATNGNKTKQASFNMVRDLVSVFSASVKVCKSPRKTKRRFV